MLRAATLLALLSVATVPPAAAAPNPATPNPATPNPAGPDAAPWVPRGGVEVQVLDKVNARSKVLTVRPGGQAQFGSLTIATQRCLVRPPGRPQDAAAYLAVTDSHPGAPAFHGWMFQSAPSASMLEHPIYDVRVLGCTA